MRKEISISETGFAAVLTTITPSNISFDEFTRVEDALIEQMKTIPLLITPEIVNDDIILPISLENEGREWEEIDYFA